MGQRSLLHFVNGFEVYCTLAVPEFPLTFSPNSSKVKEMVNLVEDWAVLEEYAGDKQGYYQLLSNEGVSEVRVATGKLGFKRGFSSSVDPLLTRVLDFCRLRGYIRVSEAVRDEVFFK
jgi:hypothetical protein